jgi:CBS-domain-containing membrane protein
VTLLFGLTAAPASQPRNVLVGQALSLSIAMVVSYFDNSISALWLRQSLATAIAVAAMVKLGITHPPAGASALIFASGEFDWTHVLAFFVANVIAIGVATIINNTSNKRQYPMYWGISCLEERVREQYKSESQKND